MPILDFHLVEGQFTDEQHERLLVEGSRIFAEGLRSPIERVRVFVHLHRPELTAVGGAVVAKTGTQAPYFRFVVLEGGQSRSVTISSPRSRTWSSRPSGSIASLSAAAAGRSQRRTGRSVAPRRAASARPRSRHASRRQRNRDDGNSLYDRRVGGHDVRGSADGDRKAIHLMAALTHGEGRDMTIERDVLSVFSA